MIFMLITEYFYLVYLALTPVKYSIYILAAETQYVTKNGVLYRVKTQIINAHKNGCGYKSVSKQFDIPKSTVQNIIQKFKKFNTVQNLYRARKKGETFSWIGLTSRA